MNKYTLEKLRAEIAQAEELADCAYIDLYSDKPCYCAVGHVFLLGGAERSDMESVLVDGRMNGDSITVVHNDETVAEWLDAAGFDIASDEDIEFLSRLQAINDDTNGGKEEVLKFLDKTIDSLA